MREETVGKERGGKFLFGNKVCTGDTRMWDMSLVGRKVNTYGILGTF